jgi:hypothetical protein
MFLGCSVDFLEEIMQSLNFTIGPNELWLVAVAAASFVSWYIGRAQGAKVGYQLGGRMRTIQIDHMLIHALDEETQKKVTDSVRVYLADPVNKAHIEKNEVH